MESFISMHCKYSYERTYMCSMELKSKYNFYFGLVRFPLCSPWHSWQSECHKGKTIWLILCNPVQNFIMTFRISTNLHWDQIRPSLDAISNKMIIINKQKQCKQLSCSQIPFSLRKDVTISRMTTLINCYKMGNKIIRQSH